jgi:uncharacterized spore protein YtfJ
MLTQINDAGLVNAYVSFRSFWLRFSSVPADCCASVLVGHGGDMKDVENLFSKAIEEIERLLNTKTVVGEPIIVDGNTLIPLVSVGFGFGVGGGEGTDPKKGAGTGGGTGGGGGVKPVAMIVVNKDGVRLESIKGGTASVLEKVVETVGKAASAKSGSGRAE